MTALKGHAKVRVARAFNDPEHMSDAALEAEVQALLDADAVDSRRWMCEDPECDGRPHTGWLHMHARASQRIPSHWWTEWLILAGRGWGKTYTASQTVYEWAKVPNQRIAVIAKNETLVREICFESPKSGLNAVIPPDEVLKYTSSRGSVAIYLTNGTIIQGFGAEVPDNLRGWAFDKAWCDEYAAWKKQTAQATYDMLWFCLRESDDPQVIISTTPKPLPHIKALLNQHRTELAQIDGGEREHVETVVTNGKTSENRANLSKKALAKIDRQYAGTRLGAQELDGLVLEDVEGALWNNAMLDWEGFRIEPGPLVPYMDRKVVAVDPATTSGEGADNTGIAVVGRSYSFDVTWEDGLPRAYVLASEEMNATPRNAMQRAIDLYHQHGADAIVVEANNGGEYLSTVIHMLDPTVIVRTVHASRDKRARAAPVAALYEQERVHHVSLLPMAFNALEDVMLTFVGVSGEDSPDLLDALVWAVWDLLLDPTTPHPDLTTNDHRLRGRR